MNISQITSADPEFGRFEQFAGNHPDAHFFQSGLFFKFIDGIGNYSPLLFICKDEKGEIRGSLLAVFQSGSNRLMQRFGAGIIIRGGPLLDHTNGEEELILGALLETLVAATKKKALFIQFRNFSDLSKFIPAFRNSGFTLKGHQNLITETTDEQKAWSQLKENRKRQIRKSLQNGASVIRDPSPAQYRKFYEILAGLYKTRVHKPLPPWPFFRKFYEEVYGSSSGIIHLVSFADEIIGGILCPVSGKKMVHEWYVCGLDHAYREQGIYPSVLVTWSAIEYAAKNGIAAFDFLGLGNPEQHYGVREFKLKFGGTLVNFGRFERINNRFLYSLAMKGHSLLQSIILPNKGRTNI